MPRLPALCALVLLAACSGPPRAPVSLSEQLAATIPGIPDARAWGDADAAGLEALGLFPDQLAARGPGPLDFLALSSGGPGGAYGAGLLVGWGQAGDRPAFDVVAGVSSGALIAPFAFVGAEGDAALRALWASDAAREFGRDLDLPGLVTGDGVVDPGPLRDLIEAHVDDALVAAIARGHAEGRRLLVLTTNLDAQRPVIWNLGAIAASGQPGAAALIRRVLLASASIPVALPPVFIDAVAGGRAIDEMHVDGGVTSQIFAFPDAVLADGGAFAVPEGREATLWLVANYVLGPEFVLMRTGSFGVGARSYSTLIKSDLRSELFAIEAAAEEAGIDVRIASIPGSIPWTAQDPFGTSSMRPLFDRGERDGRAGVGFGPVAGGS